MQEYSPLGQSMVVQVECRADNSWVSTLKGFYLHISIATHTGVGVQLINMTGPEQNTQGQSQRYAQSGEVYILPMS